MRMRRKKNLESRLAACGELLLGRLPVYGEEDPVPLDLREIFGSGEPIRLEIGCGKGQFAEEIARRNPSVGFLAVEQVPNVLVTAMERAKRAGLTNLKFLSGNAETLGKALPPGSVERIYLNFSCPYPKTRYEKYRLTHSRFLEIYRALLAQGGYIVQKTDNRSFFEYSLNSYADHGFRLRRISLDLHNSGIEGNIITEYEEKFSSEGFPIYYTEAVPIPDVSKKIPESSLQIPKKRV